MDYSKFYTPPKIAGALVNELRIEEPDKVVDICCGSCNLLFAVKERWPGVGLYGVDVLEHAAVENIIFQNKDGRLFAIEHAQEFSLVVANPPFDYVEKKNQYPSLYMDKFEDISTSRLEIEMLLANLKLLKSNGVLLVIMPSSFVEAKTYRKIRKAIASQFYIESIIKLDETTFGTSKINSYALIIRNELQQNRCAKIGASSADSNNRITYTTGVDSNRLKDGVWTVENTNIEEVSINIRRGNISSASFISRGQPILHTSKSSAVWEPSKRFVSKKIQPTVFAESGDIIVSRIGKSAGHWCVYHGDKVAISDCLYRIKDPDGSILSKIRGKQYDRSLKGVATRYITMLDICSWIERVSGL